MDFEKSARDGFVDTLLLKYDPLLVYPKGIRVTSVELVRGRKERVRVKFIVDMLQRPAVLESVLRRKRFQERTIEIDRQDLNAHPDNPPFGLIWERPSSVPLNIASMLEYINGYLETEILPSDLMAIDMTKNPIVIRIKEDSLFYFGTVNVNLL